MTIVQLVYRSEKTPFLNASAFESDCMRYSSSNDALGITGILVSLKSTFVGVLEGREDNLFALMERIISDNRHRHINVLYEESAGRPRFANWHYGAIENATHDSSGQSLGEFLAAELRASLRIAGTLAAGFPDEAVIR